MVSNPCNSRLLSFLWKQEPILLKNMKAWLQTKLSGVDLRYIQEILGHNSSKTTEIYTHVTFRNIQNIKSPFDEL